MKETLEKRITELKKFIRTEWNTCSERDEAEEKLERLEQLYNDLYGIKGH